MFFTYEEMVDDQDEEQNTYYITYINIIGPEVSIDGCIQEIKPYLLI